MVLLDHGLYKQIPDELRLDYAALWQALIFGDPKANILLKLLRCLSFSPDSQSTQIHFSPCESPSDLVLALSSEDTF